MEVFRKRLEHKKQRAQEHRIEKPTDNNNVQVEVETRAKTGLEFLEVVNAEENEEMNQANYQKQISSLEKKAKISDNPDSNAAIEAAIVYLKDNHEKSGEQLSQEKEDLGIYTYFFTDGACDY